VERAVALPRVVKVPLCPLLGGVGVGGVLVVDFDKLNPADFPCKRVNLPKSRYNRRLISAILIGGIKWILKLQTNTWKN